MSAKANRRRFWMLLHRWIGVITFLFLVIAGLTGSAIAFWRDIDSTLNADWYQVKAAEQRQTIENLLEIVQSQFPDSQPYSVVLNNAANASLIVYLANDPSGTDVAFINPYNGEILGGRDNDDISINRRHLMPFLYRIRYSLGFGQFGENVLGVIALLCLVMTIIGVWLAWPKQRKWRKALSVKTTAGNARFMFDLHRAGGLLVSSFFMMILWTSLWWNMDYVIRPAMDAVLPRTPVFSDTYSISEPASHNNLGIEHAVAIALSSRPTAKAYYVRLMPEKRLYMVYLRMPEDKGPYGRTYAFINFSGELLHIDDPHNNSLGDSYAEWQLPLHTGQFLGIPGRVVWAVIGVTPLLFGISGFYLWLRKINIKNAKNKVDV